MAEDFFPGQGDFKKYTWLFPPEGFKPFNRNNLFNTPAPAPGPSQETVLETIIPPPNYRGWVRWIGLEASNFQKVFYTIRKGGAPIDDYTRIVVPLGNPATPISIFIEMEPNRTLELVATYTAATLALRYMISGWFYPER